jgi:predicted nuclease of predicted toxin-antitoxin system
MKFLVDAQIPHRLALAINAQGYDALHTLDLPDAKKTTDSQINILSEQDQRIVITKDGDFVNSFLVSGRPYKRLLISTGNITNRDLEALFLSHLSQIAESFQEHRFLELNRTALIIHS